MTTLDLIVWALGIATAVGGLVALGFWIARGISEDRAAEAEAARQLADLEARPSLLLADRVSPGIIALAPRYHMAPADLGPGRLPGYADPFPRAGLFDVTVPLEDTAAAPHVDRDRPSPSPVDLEADVRRMCDETELYVAALIARTRHAERKYTW